MEKQLQVELTLGCSWKDIVLVEVELSMVAEVSKMSYKVVGTTLSGSAFKKSLTASPVFISIE